MRTITYFSEKPKEREVIALGKKVNVYIRTDIEEAKGEERLEWKAVEYWAQFPNTKSFALTDELVEKIIAKETEKEAERVRQIRNQLLAASDCEVLPDRLTKSSSAFKAWSEYRQALRDITKQKSFPFEVVFPDKPSA